MWFRKNVDSAISHIHTGLAMLQDAVKREEIVVVNHKIKIEKEVENTSKNIEALVSVHEKKVSAENDRHITNVSKIKIVMSVSEAAAQRGKSMLENLFVVPKQIEKV